MKELNITITVRKTMIASEEEAKRYTFLDSPAVRINGVQIDPTERNSWLYLLQNILTKKWHFRAAEDGRKEIEGKAKTPFNGIVLEGLQEFRASAL